MLILVTFSVSIQSFCFISIKEENLSVISFNIMEGSMRNMSAPLDDFVI